MKQVTNANLFKVWSGKVGGPTKATLLIMNSTGLSASTAEKLANGRYPSVPSYLAQKALAELTGFDHEELFPFVQVQGTDQEAS